MEPGFFARQQDQEFLSGLAERLREIEEGFRNRAAAAAAAGVSKTAYQKWVEARTVPSFESMARLSAQTGFLLEWIAFGIEPKTRQPSGATSGGESGPSPFDSSLWDDIFNVVSDIATMNAQPLALARHHQVVHDIYNRAARFATVAERNAAITVLVVDRVAAAHEAQSAHERLEARRRKPPEPQPAPNLSNPEEPV